MFEIRNAFKRIIDIKLSFLCNFIIGTFILISLFRNGITSIHSGQQEIGFILLSQSSTPFTLSSKVLWCDFTWDLLSIENILCITLAKSVTQ
jgi:hypothetical protein